MHVPGTAGRTIAALAALAIAFGCEPKDPTVNETPVKIVKETTGVGSPATEGDLVTISYRLRLEDGRVILSDDTYKFVVGQGTVISGVDNAVRGMQVTGQREILVPPHLHWGRMGYGDNEIPPDQTLSMVLRLEAID